MLRLLSFVAFVSFVAPLPAADWPQFRGPTGDGRMEAQNLPTKWNERTNVAWRAEIPGKGWSSPSLSNDRLYLTTAVAVDAARPDGLQSLRALCVDAATGRIAWNVEIFRPDTTEVSIHSKNSHASPTPLASGERIYVHFGHYG